MKDKVIQWNPLYWPPLGPKISVTIEGGHKPGVLEVLFNGVGTKVSGHYREVATHQGWPLRGVPL